MASDLTEASIPALRAALELARRVGAQLTALHVTEPLQEGLAKRLLPKETEFLRGIVGREQETAQRVLDEQVKTAQATPNWEALHVRTMVLGGSIAETIVSTAAEVGAELIVVGTHARKGLQHAILGSIAERVLRLAPCLVLVAKRESSS